MKKAALALTLILALLVSLLVGVQFVDVTEANYIPPWAHLVINSPATYEKQDSNSAVLLNVTIGLNVWIKVDYNTVKVEYSLDGHENITMPIFHNENEFGEYLSSITSLPKLSNGPHRLTVYMTYSEEVGNITRNIVNSETRRFILGESESLPTPSATDIQPTPETATLLASFVFMTSASIALVNVGLLVYFKKRKH